MEIIHVNPDSLHKNPAFSQGILVRGDHDTLYIGGQNGTDASGAIIEGGAGAQSAQAMRNVLAVLEEVGADASNVVRLAIHLHPDASLEEAFGGAMQVWGGVPSTVTVLRVAPVRPEALVEVDAVAVVPRA
ncbi:RidA family protein [Agromyces sp. G08B096]|uniref:RidA family protein n=1 Tax=Agromyces sp. G08B096 TaxID=3156399 RepID=A0AAU7W5P8_9MICO